MTDEETDCPHTETTDKFSGMTVCDNCGAGVGHWSRPPARLSALRHPDGTFETA